MAELVDEEATRKLFNEIAPKYADRQGGFTRIYKLVLAAVTLLKWQLSSSSDWYKQLT